MNDNELVNNNSNNNTYRATTNLNTAIENPQVNINSAMGVNIQNVSENNSNVNDIANYQNNSFSSNNYVDNNVVDSTVTNFINANNSANNVTVPTSSDNSSYNVVSNNSNNQSNEIANNGDVATNYEPTIESKKRKGIKIAISKELKMMIFVIMILVVFIMIIPSIYDFFRNLGLVISG